MNYREKLYEEYGKALNQILEEVKGNQELEISDMADSVEEFQKVFEGPDKRWDDVSDHVFRDMEKIKVKEPSNLYEKFAEKYMGGYELENCSLDSENRFFGVKSTGMLLNDVQRKEMKLLEKGFDFRIHLYSKDETLGTLLDERNITGKIYRNDPLRPDWKKITILDTDRDILVPDYNSLETLYEREKNGDETGISIEGENHEVFARMLIEEKPETIEELYDIEIRHNDMISEPMYHTMLSKMAESDQKMMREYAESIRTGSGDPYR